MSAISVNDITEIIQHARRIPADMKGDIVSGEGDAEYYRFSSGLVDFHAPNKDVTRAIIDQIYGENHDVKVMRLGIIAVPTHGRAVEEIQEEFVEKLISVDPFAITKILNIKTEVKKPVYKENVEKTSGSGLLGKLNPFKSAESRITKEERAILEDIADIIASDGKYTREEKQIMQTIQELIIEEDVTRDDMNDAESEIGKLVAELRMLNRPGVETADEVD